MLNPTCIFKFTRTACCLLHSCRKLFLKDESFHNSNHFHLTSCCAALGILTGTSRFLSFLHSPIPTSTRCFGAAAVCWALAWGPGREGRMVDAWSLHSGKHRVMNQQMVTQDLQPRELRATSGKPRQPGGQKKESPRLGNRRRFTERSLDCFEAGQPSASC